MSYKLAIFDLDGTLLNTIRDLADSVNYALEKNGFPQRTLEEVTKFVGNGIRKLVVRAVPKGTDEHMTDVVFEDFKEYYGKHCADKTEKYPGIDYVLDSLHKERCRTAVISNKADYAVKILCDDFFPGKFDAVYGERESMGIKKKPDPQAVLAVLDEFKTDRKDAVYIGDSEVDIATAKNAGVDGIIVSWGFREKEILIQNGHRRIAGIFKYDDMQGIERYKGFVECLSDYGVKFDDDWIRWYSTKDMEEKLSKKGLLRMYRRTKDCTAMIVYNDEVAGYYMEFLEERGLHVPEDVSLVSFDDEELQQDARVKVLSVVHPKYNLGRITGKNLLRMMDDPDWQNKNYSYRFPVSINDGNSVKDIR